MISDEVRLKREEISPGVVLEHFQQLVDSENLYILKLEVLVFRRFEIFLDFSATVNAQLRGKSDGMSKSIVLEPYSKVTVARFVLDKNWVVDVKAKANQIKPGIDMQRQYLETYNSELRKKIDDCRQWFGDIDLYILPQEMIIDVLNKHKTNFIDPDFPPVDSNWSTDIASFEDATKCVVHWRRAKFLYLPLQQATSSKALPPNIYKKEANDKEGEVYTQQPSLRSMVETANSIFNVTTHLYSSGILKSSHHENDCLSNGRAFFYQLRCIYSAIRRNKELLFNIFGDGQSNIHGMYRVNLHRMGRKITIVLDDYFPCAPFCSTFTADANGEYKPDFGLLLLEKAFAKLNGGYHNLAKSPLRNLLTDITGAPTHKLKIKEDLAESQEEIWLSIVSHLNSNSIILAKKKAYHKDARQEDQKHDLKRNFCYLSLVSATVNSENQKMVTLKFVSNDMSLAHINTEVFTKAEDIESELKQRNSMDLSDLKLNVSNNKITILFETLLHNFNALYISTTSAMHKLNIKGKFVSRFESSSEDTIRLSSRYCYQIDIQNETYVSLAIQQEDQSPPLVKSLRPNQDLEVWVYKKDQDSYSCVHYETPKIQRDAIANLKLEQGTYLIVPVSLKFIQLPDTCEMSESRHFLKDDPKLIIAIQDTFEKFNMSGTDQMSFKELALFFKMFNLELTETKFKRLCKKYLSIEFAYDFEPEGLGKKGFMKLFIGLLISGKLGESVPTVMRSLGYESSMLCFGSRLFGLSIHSSEYLSIAMKDSFKDNLEEIPFETILENEGHEIVSYTNGSRNISVIGYLCQ